MPSDSKKREQARKKDAQKKRGQKIVQITKDTPADDELRNGVNGTNGLTNGATNGGPVELTEEGENEIQLFSILTSKFKY